MSDVLNLLEYEFAFVSGTRLDDLAFVVHAYERDAFEPGEDICWVGHCGPDGIQILGGGYGDLRQPWRMADGRICVPGYLGSEPLTSDRGQGLFQFDPWNRFGLPLPTLNLPYRLRVFVVDDNYSLSWGGARGVSVIDGIRVWYVPGPCNAVCMHGLSRDLIYAGGYGGLWRWNGERFDALPTPQPNFGVTAVLVQAPDRVFLSCNGKLYVGAEADWSVVCDDSHIYTLFERDGRVHAKLAQQLCVLHNGRWVPTRTLPHQSHLHTHDGALLAWTRSEVIDLADPNAPRLHLRDVDRVILEGPRPWTPRALEPRPRIISR